MGPWYEQHRLIQQLDHDLKVIPMLMAHPKCWFNMKDSHLWAIPNDGCHSFFLISTPSFPLCFHESNACSYLLPLILRWVLVYPFNLLWVSDTDKLQKRLLSLVWSVIENFSHWFDVGFLSLLLPCKEKDRKQMKQIPRTTHNNKTKEKNYVKKRKS